LLRHREKKAEVRDVHAEHAAIADVALSRDTRGVVRLMEAHLTATENSVAHLLEAGLRRDRKSKETRT
jgi:DNA-binding GntR family transcriptional regulator